MLQLPSASWPWRAVLLYMSLLFRTWRSLPKTAPALAVLRPYCHPPLGSDVSLMLAAMAERLLPPCCCFFRRPACASPVGSSAVGSISLAALPLCWQKKREQEKKPHAYRHTVSYLSHLISNYIKVHLTPTNISLFFPSSFVVIVHHSSLGLLLSLSYTVVLFRPAVPLRRQQRKTRLALQLSRASPSLVTGRRRPIDVVPAS